MPGMIYPSVRAIAVGYEKELKVIYYLDRDPNEEDRENISDFTGEILADINFSEVDEECPYSNLPFSSLNHLDS